MVSAAAVVVVVVVVKRPPVCNVDDRVNSTIVVTSLFPSSKYVPQVSSFPRQPK